MRMIDADALKRDWRLGDVCENCQQDAWRCQYNYDYTLMDICEMLDDAETVELPGWVSVEDRLPESDDHVLCCTMTKSGRRNVVIGYYMDGSWRCGMNSNVTHWMPLPEPPQREES